MVAELSLTVPITNSLAFLFTVLGEWWAEGKVISRGRVLFLWAFSLRLFPFGAVGLIADGFGDRYLDWDGVCVGWDCALCAVEDYVRM